MFDDLNRLVYRFKEIYNKQNLFDDKFIKNLEGDCYNTKIT